MNIAWLTTNRTCNCRCYYCYGQKAKQKEMDFDSAKQLLPSLKELGIQKVILIGGEPTLYPHYLELLGEIQNNQMKPAIATNGILFDNLGFCQASAQAGLSNVNVSLKATNALDYQKVAGCDVFTQVLKGYQNLKRVQIPTVLSYVIAKKDFSKIDELLSLLLDIEATQILFQLVKPVVGESQRLDLSMRDMADIVEYLYHAMKATKELQAIDYKIELSIPFCFIQEEILLDMLSAGRFTYGCHMRKGTGIVFDTTLQVLPCNHFVNFPYQQSRVNSKEAVEKLWVSPEVEHFRKTVNTYPSLKCKNCRYMPKCRGGCFTRWLSLDPKIEIPGFAGANTEKQ